MSAAVAGGGGGGGVGASGFDIGGLPTFDSGDAVRSAAAELAGAVHKVHSHAVSVKSGWTKLAGAYNAPEQHVVLAAMNKPETVAADLSGKVDGVKAALDTYAGRLDELQTRKNSLISQITSLDADVQKYKDDSISVPTSFGVLGALGIGGHVEIDLHHGLSGILNGDSGLKKREDHIRGAIDQLAADYDQYQRDCRNAINLTYECVPAYVAADDPSATKSTGFGLSKDGYAALDQQGKTAWGSPDYWRNASLWSATQSTAKGAWDGTVVQPWNFAGDLVGAHGGAKAGAAWSGLATLGKAGSLAGNPLMLAGALGYSLVTGGPGAAEKEAESVYEPLLQTGKSVVGWDTMTTDPFYTEGEVVPNVLLAVATDGGGAAVKGAVGALARVAPATADSLRGMAEAAAAAKAASWGRVADVSTSAAALRRAMRDVPIRQYVGPDVSKLLGGAHSGVDPSAVTRLPEWLKRVREGTKWHRVQQSRLTDEAGGVAELYVHKPGVSLEDVGAAVFKAKGYNRVDHYIWEGKQRGIYSMKYTQLSEIDLKTAFKYLHELDAKYKPGTVVAEVPSTPGALVGKTLRGQKILMVPDQVVTIPKSVSDLAKRLDIKIIEVP